MPISISKLCPHPRRQAKQSYWAIALLTWVVIHWTGSSHPSLKAEENAQPEESVSASIQLDASILSTIKDRTRGIREAEQGAYYQTLSHARATNYGEQQRVARENLIEFEKKFDAEQAAQAAQTPDYQKYRYSLFADLLQRPTEYRGKLLSLRGHIRRLEAMEIQEGEQPPRTVYQAYLFTDDSRTYPYIVVCDQIPEGIPQGGDILEDVTVTGYFFKIYAYDAQDQARVAPMILAQKLEWLPSPEAEAPSNLLPIITAITAGLLILLFVLRRIASRDRLSRQNHLRTFAERDWQAPADSPIEIEADGNPDETPSPEAEQNQE